LKVEKVYLLLAIFLLQAGLKDGCFFSSKTPRMVASGKKCYLSYPFDLEFPWLCSSREIGR
jgi:hypothetical protein